MTLLYVVPIELTSRPESLMMSLSCVKLNLWTSSALSSQALALASHAAKSNRDISCCAAIRAGKL